MTPVEELYEENAMLKAKVEKDAAKMACLEEALARVEKDAAKMACLEEALAKLAAENASLKEALRPKYK